MTRTLYTEDINELIDKLLTSYPLLAHALSETDEDVIDNMVSDFLDPYSAGYRNYN